MKVYLAGSITGKSYEEVMSIFNYKADKLRSMGYDILSPMTGKAYLRTETTLKPDGYLNPVSTNHAIFERDKWMVNNSDIVLADLSECGERVSIGTMMELAWANMLGKHTILIMQPDNIHVHAFVKEAADIIFDSVTSALAYLSDLATNT